MLKVIYEKHKTGFEENKDFQTYPGDVIAGKYEVLSVIGEAAFSITYKCRDILGIFALFTYLYIVNYSLLLTFFYK